jgi:branched-chain amino acid aminotransferase
MNREIAQIDAGNFSELLKSLRKPWHENYLAMYSSVYDAIVKDPTMMLVPIDDHMVHRGDGVFETFKCVDGAIYNLAAHMQRLQHSAANLNFTLPMELDEIKSIAGECIRAGGARDCYIRMFISRGPGSFGVNPYDCPQTQLYIAVTKAPPPFMDRHPAGATLRTSSIPVKDPFFAGVKNCNYLNNVLMKREAVDSGADFVVAFDRSGRLAEGATENIGIVSSDDILTFPNLDGILTGTTMLRVMNLAERAVEQWMLKSVRFGDIYRDDMLAAKEILIVGTTTNVTRVKEFDGQPVGNDGSSAIYNLLSELLYNDIHNNPAMRTQIF